MERKYFDNLNGLRFFAAITVAVSHLETVKSYKENHFLLNRFIENSAQLAVTFFFVLSGYLISWWFLEDTKGAFDKIDVKAFYVRRFSRTWPLYFAVIFFSILISIFGDEYSRDINLVKRYFAYLLFLPNTADLNYTSNIYLGQTWSLAVEEFFYLLFPILLIFVRKHLLAFNYILLLCGFLFFSILLNPIFIHLVWEKFNSIKPHSYFIAFFERYRIYSFLIGGLTAWFYYNHEKSIKNIINVKLSILSNVLTLVVLFFYLTGITFSFLTQQIYSIFFAFIVLFFVSTEKSYWILTNKLIKNGGKYSYGIYMLHMFVIMRLTNQGSFLYNVESKSLSIFISWFILIVMVSFISYLSYRFFERPVQEKIINFYTRRIP